jgi:hypothetical protein
MRHGLFFLFLSIPLRLSKATATYDPNIRRSLDQSFKFVPVRGRGNPSYHRGDSPAQSSTENLNVRARAQEEPYLFTGGIMIVYRTVPIHVACHATAIVYLRTPLPSVRRNNTMAQ